MKNYNQVFNDLNKRKEGALIAFTVIGDPDFKASLHIAKNLADSGADILELGLPFSDPIADGPTIQAADIRALENGMNTDRAFEYVIELRKHTDVPIGFLSYYNIIYQYGIERFYKNCRNSGVNSILIADMPLEEINEISSAAKRNNVETVLMISQLTGNDRIKKIAGNAQGFIYVISRLGVTGAKVNLEKSTLNLVRKIRKFTKKPLCIGFGISRPQHVHDVIKAGADGAIVGSAIVNLIEKNIGNNEKMLNDLSDYIKRMKNATRLS